MRSSRVANNKLDPGLSPSPSKNLDSNPDPDRGQEAIPGHVPEAILTVVLAGLDPETLPDLDPEEEVDPDPILQTFQSDAALLHFWKKGE